VHALHTESSIEVANDVDDRPYTVWHGYKMPPSHKVATSRLLLPSTFPKTNQVDPMSARLPSPRNRHCLAHMACPSFRGAAALPKNAYVPHDGFGCSRCAVSWHLHRNFKWMVWNSESKSCGTPKQNTGNYMSLPSVRGLRRTRYKTSGDQDIRSHTKVCSIYNIEKDLHHVT
jgi:hypothetical protein